VTVTRLNVDHRRLDGEHRQLRAVEDGLPRFDLQPIEEFAVVDEGDRHAELLTARAPSPTRLAPLQAHRLARRGGRVPRRLEAGGGRPLRLRADGLPRGRSLDRARTSPRVETRGHLSGPCELCGPVRPPVRPSAGRKLD
jgi:hypothetical protein